MALTEKKPHRTSRAKAFHLFVYGTLMDPAVFRAVTGLRLTTRWQDADGEATFHGQAAVLSGYKKISPDSAYLYAVPAEHGRIHGLLIGPLPGEVMVALRHYEGRNYSKRTLDVWTAAGRQRAVAFVGRMKNLQHAFGYDFHDPLKQEVLLDEKIEAALLEAERRQLGWTERAARRAVAELHGPAIRDLKRRHFEAGGISDYAIRRSLVDEDLRDLGPIRRDPAAQAVAANYLDMVIRQVIFNQFEDRLQKDFRYELDQMRGGEEFYPRTISSLVALHMINSSETFMDLLAADCHHDLSFRRNQLLHFVRYAVIAADAAYDAATAGNHLRLIRAHMGGGYTPMGAELEFSNIGHGVIRDPEGKTIRDSAYDGFLYFPDFGLDALTWKLGGHVDDHHDKASPRRRRGFFEVALGNLSIEANISKPLTGDPWVLNRFIHEARRFYRIAPHSVHISLQLRTQHRPARDHLLPLAALKCLFAIGGDPARLGDGRVRIRRLTDDEIIRRDEGGPHMLFSEVSRRHSSEADDAIAGVGSPASSGRYVQQFKFLRLAKDINYELLAMALKGLQIHNLPGTFMTASQYRQLPRHRQTFDDLVAWGTQPCGLAAEEIDEFLTSVRDGLRVERRGKPAHSRAYLARVLDELEAALRRFNEQLR
jgi:hypothetical protein